MLPYQPSEPEVLVDPGAVIPLRKSRIVGPPVPAAFPASASQSKPKDVVLPAATSEAKLIGVNA